MPISRCQIRNEYSLADPELYKAADKDDPEALLEGVAMAGLVGVLRQLGDLAEFAAEIFHDLHEEVMATAARGHGLMNRVQQLEAEFPSIEKVFLSQINHSSFFTNTGTDWHPSLQSKQNLITQGDLPRFVMDSYEECRGPPRLFLLDKFDVAGAGACLTRYTDPSFFKMEVASSGPGIARVEAHREKRSRKAKQKKGTRWRNGETTLDIAPTHAKLHQLLLEERMENAYSDPARLVKLKKRQLNGSGLEAKSRKSYMDKFLETPLDHKMVCETSIIPLPEKSVSDDASETGVRILEISTFSPVKRSMGNESACSSPNEQEIELKPSSDMGREDDLLKAHKQMDAGVMDEMPPSHLYVPGESELADHGPKMREGSIDGYHSDDAISEVDNYSDALTTMDSEMETDNEFRPKNSFLDIQKVTGTDGKEEHQELQSRFSDSQSSGDSSTSYENSSFKRGKNEVHTELQARLSDSRSIGTSSTSDGNSSSKRDRNEHMELQDHFSDSHSIGNSSTSDKHNSFKKDRSSFSRADSINTMVENIQSDGYIEPTLLSHTKYYVSKIEDAPSNQQTQMVGSQKTTVELNMRDDIDNQEEDIPDFGQASPSSCLKTSEDIFLHSYPGATSSAVAVSTEIQLGETPSDPVELHSALSDDGDRDHVEKKAAVPDAHFLMKDDAGSAVSSEKDPLSKLGDGDPHFNSDALLHVSNVSELVPEDQCSDHPTVTVLSTESQNQNFSEVFVTREIDSPEEHSICRSMGEVDLSPDNNTLPFDGLDLKSEDCLLVTQINLEDLSPVAETPSDNSFIRMHCSDLSHESTQEERDPAGVEVLYSDQQSNVEVISRMVHHDEISGSTNNVDENDGYVEHPSSPDFVLQQNHVLLNDVVTEQVQLEDKTGSIVPSFDSAENQASIVISQASGLISSSHNLDNSEETLPDSLYFHQMEMESIKVESIENVDLELEKRGNQLEQSSDMTSNFLSSPVSNVTYSQESHSTFMDPQEEIDVNEAVAGESLIELEAQMVVNQLEVASADVQSSPNRTLSCDPSDLGMSNNIQAAPSDEKIQYSVSVDDVTMVHGFSDMDTQELESKSFCQNDLLNGEDAMSLSPFNHKESETPSKLLLPSQDVQRNAECLLIDENSASEMVQSEQIQTSNELKQERTFTVSEPAPKFHLDQPSSLESSQSVGEDINPAKDAMDHVTSIFPDLSPKEAEANLEEMPPMPPLPPMQWRTAKIQHASLASQRESIEVIPASFLQTQSIGIDGKAQFGLLGSERETLPYQNPFLPVMTMEADKFPHTSGFSAGVSGHPIGIPLQFPVMVNDANSQYNYLLLQRSQIQNPLLTLPVISTGRPPHGYVFTSEGGVVQYSNASLPMPPLESAPGHDSPQAQLVQPSSQLTIDTSSDQQSSSNMELPLENAGAHDSPQEKLVQPSNPFRTDTSLEVMALQQSSSNGEAELRDPLLSSMSTLRMEAVQPHTSLLPLEGEMALSSDTSASMFEGENPNGKPKNKLLRPRNPLIDAVAAHDKSKLRKVTERVRPQPSPKEEERDSLLEQIRTKSFNLKPAVVTRPSIKRGPNTNLKVAAILEKANAIRQALAGSDEDDDGDSWSDS